MVDVFQAEMSPTDLGLVEDFSSLWLSSLEGAVTMAAIAGALGPPLASQGLCRYTLNPKH